MLWKEYVEKKVSKKQKNWLTGIGIYFLVEIGGIWLFMISIFLLYRFYLGENIVFLKYFRGMDLSARFCAFFLRLD